MSNSWLHTQLLGKKSVVSVQADGHEILVCRLRPHAISAVKTVRVYCPLVDDCENRYIVTQAVVDKAARHSPDIIVYPQFMNVSEEAVDRAKDLGIPLKRAGSFLGPL